MLRNPLLEKLRTGRIVLGFANTYPAPGIIEMMCRGTDFVWIDGQHGQFSYDSALHAVRTAASLGIDAVVRVPGHETGILGPYADMAPAALMAPMVDTPEQARAIVRATRFPPLGQRSYGGRRPGDLEGRDYYRTSEVALVAQIETLEAVRNARAIAEVPGVDVLFFGPDDMKLRLDLPVNTALDSPELRDALRATAEAARAAGKFAGLPAATAATAAVAIELGYTMLAIGGDAAFLRTYPAEKLQEMRGLSEGRQPAAAKAQAGTSIYG